MNRRLLRNLGSVFVLAAYALVASGTSQQGPERMGEFPFGLFVHNNTAYLLHYATGPYTPGPNRNQSLYLTSISSDGSLSPLRPVSIPHTEDGYITAAVTADTKGAVAFVVVSASSKGPFSIVLTDTGGPTEVTTQTVGYPSSWYGEDAQLTFMKRDANRYWVYYSRAVHDFSGNEANQDDSAKFPLFEIEDGRAVVLADRVVWARCDESVCQQVRYEDQKLRLYANPVTSDLYLHAVTEVAASGTSHESTFDENGQPVLIVGDAQYALSATNPSLRFVRTLEPSPYREPSIWEREKRFSGYFSNGVEIRAYPMPDEARKSYCDDDCQGRYDVYQTIIELVGFRGRVNTFSVHDY